MKAIDTWTDQYLAGLLYFGLDTNKNTQALHHLSQFTRICISIFTHVEHQTHRQTILKINSCRYSTNNCVEKRFPLPPSNSESKGHSTMSCCRARHTPSGLPWISREGGLWGSLRSGRMIWVCVWCMTLRKWAPFWPNRKRCCWDVTSSWVVTIPPVTSDPSNRSIRIQVAFCHVKKRGDVT